MGNAAFVSHQWVARQHPDPEFRQMSVLQDTLKHLLGSGGHVLLDIATEQHVRSARPLPTKDFQSRALFVWYDYFSVPQSEHRESHASDNSDGSQQANAINSIPAYVAKCKFFLALCPVLDRASEEKVLSPRSWAERGWCRVERAARELSPDSTWILIQGTTRMELVGTAISFPSGSVGEGRFTVEEDRQKLAPVMRSILTHKLMHCLRTRDFPAFRRHLNLQSVHLRGLEIEPVHGVLPNEAPNALSRFLFQNGLGKVDASDSAGWWPLHYAALSGNAEVIQEP